MQKLTSAIQPIAIKRLFKKRAIIFYQGEIPRAAHVVQRGLIKMYGINTSGEEQIVSFHGPGDIFPLPWIFDKTSNTLFYYEAVTDCEVLTLPKKDLLHIIGENPHLYKEVFDYFVNKHTGLLLRVTALEQTRAQEKIMFTLYYLLFHYGREIKPDIYTIDIKLTQPMIASLVGLTRETITKTLSQLRTRGIIQYKGPIYTINKTKFERYLGEDSFKDLLER